MSPRPQRCPKCDYDLHGLPDRHRCPECREPYDSRMLVLDGWSLPSLRADSIDLGGWTILAFLVCGPAFAARVLFHSSWPRVLVVLVGMAAILAVGFIALRTFFRSKSSAMRYLVTDDGVGRYGGRVHPWQSYSHVMLIPTGHNAWRIHIYPRRWLLFGMSTINITLHCSPADAEAMRTELERRMLDAHRREQDRSARS